MASAPGPARACLLLLSVLPLLAAPVLGTATTVSASLRNFATTSRSGTSAVATTSLNAAAVVTILDSCNFIISVQLKTAVVSNTNFIPSSFNAALYVDSSAQGIALVKPSLDWTVAQTTGGWVATVAGTYDSSKTLPNVATYNLQLVQTQAYSSVAVFKVPA